MVIFPQREAIWIVDKEHPPFTDLILGRELRTPVDMVVIVST